MSAGGKPAPLQNGESTRRINVAFLSSNLEAREVLAPENSKVMQFMTGDREGDRSNRYWIAVGDTLLRPGIACQVFEQKHR